MLNASYTQRTQLIHILMYSQDSPISSPCRRSLGPCLKPGLFNISIGYPSSSLWMGFVSVSVMSLSSAE
jgi:hypothetical protein